MQINRFRPSILLFILVLSLIGLLLVDSVQAKPETNEFHVEAAESDYVSVNFPRGEVEDEGFANVDQMGTPGF
jgi:hypothetical protein